MKDNNDTKTKGGGKTKGRLKRGLGVLLAGALGLGIAGVAAPAFSRGGLEGEEVLAKDIEKKNETQKQVCDAVKDGTAPTYNGKAYEDVLNDGSVYRGGKSKSGVTENKINYELDGDPNDFAAPLPYGNVFVDTNKLSWTNPADFIIDIKDDRFQWVAVDGQTWTDALGNTTTNDPLESGKKLKQIFEGENKKGGLDDSAANYGFIAYVGELKSYHSDIKTGLDENGYTNEIKAPDGDYLYRIIYLNAATLADGTRGNVMMTMKQVDIETSIEVSEKKPRTLTDKEGNTYQYTKAVLPIQGANTMRVAAGVADDQGNHVNEPNVVVKTADEVDSDIAAINAANGNVPTSGTYSYLGEKVIRHTVGGAYTFDIEVVDADGKSAVGTMAYAATDLDLPSYQTIWGRSRGTDPFMYAEGLSVLSGTQSYALVPEYNHKDATTLETGWIADGRTGSLDSALHITAGTGPNADGVRFSSIGEKVLRDKNGLWKDVLFSGAVTDNNNTLLNQPTGTIMDFTWDNINNSRVRYKNLNELWDTWVNDSQGKPHYKKTNIRRELAGKIPNGSGGYVPWDQITIQQIADYFGNGSYSVERNDYNSYDSGFAVLLDPAKTTLRWTGSSYQSGSAVTTIFDSSLYTYAEATHGTGGGIYFETYDIAGKTCDAQMEEGTVTMGRNEGITATAVPEDGYRVSRILIGDTNYGHGSSVSGLQDYTEYIIDGNDIKVNGEIVGTFSGDNVTGSTDMKTGTVTVSGFNYERDGSKVDITDKITFERNADGTVDVTLPNINNPMHVHVDFDADYYFYKVWKGDSTPEPLTMTASPAGVYPTEVTIPMPTGEYEIDGEGKPVAITEMVTFDISGARYTARNGVNAGVEFVLSPNNTVEYVEYEIPEGGGDPVEKFALRSNVVLLGNEFVHYTFDESQGEQIIDARYPVIIETSVADWDSEEAQSFTIDATSDYTDKGYVTVLEKDDVANTISPGNVVWKVKYPSEGVEELGWPALPVEMLPKDDAGAVIPNHEAATHTDRYYWFVTEEVPGWSTESYSNEKAEEPGVIPGGEEGYYGKSKWAAASIKDADTAKELIHEDHEYSYAYMSVFKDGGEITNESSIVIRGTKEWQNDFDNAYSSRKDIWLHLDAIITNPEDGSKIERKDILPPQMVAADANTTTALSKQWGTKASYTTGDANIRIVGSTQKVPGNAKLQKVDGALVHTGPYKYTRRGVTTYYYINELKEKDSDGRIYEYSIRETLDWEGNQPVVKDDIDQGLLGYKSEDVADWTEISANEDTYTYKYKYDGENRTAQLKRYTGTVENTYELMDFSVTKKWVDNKEDADHTADEIKDKITLYDANGEVDLDALGQSTTNVGTADEPKLEPLGKLTVDPESGKEITLTWEHLPKYIGDGNGNIVYAGYYAKENNTFPGYTAPMYTNVDEPGTPDVDESTDDAKAFNTGVIVNAQLIKVNVKKIWKDEDNQDGLRNDIKVTLFQNGLPYQAEGVTGEVTLKESDATKSKTTVDEDTWTWENLWGELPYADASGTQYNYAAQETSKPDGYESDEAVKQTVLTEWNEENDTLTFKATNKHDPETIDFTITKVWDDDNDHDGFRPKDGEVTYTIKADGTALTADELSNATITGGKVSGTNIQAKTTGSDGDKVTVEGLPKNKKAGQEITYTVEEATVENYTTTISGDQRTGFTVKNIHTPETVDVPVKKVWDDKEDQDGKRPNNVVFNLVADGIATELTKILNEDNNWTATFEALDRYKAGKEVIYTVLEALQDDLAKAGYTADESKGNKDGEYTITNKYTPEKVTIKATKVWDDEDNKYGIRKDVTFTLVADGTDVADSATTIAKDATGDALTVEWTVDKYKNGGTEIAYTVKESDVAPYTSSGVTGDAANGFTITNTYKPKEKTIKVTRKIEYKYIDENGEEASKTVEQTVELKRTPKTVDPTTGEVTEWNDWEIVDDKDNQEVESPEIEGWTPDRTSVPPMDIDRTKDDPQEGIEDELVIYTPDAPVGTPDETWGGKNEEQTGTPTFDETTKKTPTGEDNKIESVKLIDPKTGEPTDEKTVDAVDKDGNKVGTYTLNDDRTVTFTPEKDYVGDPEPLKLQGTDTLGGTAETTYIPHVVDNVETEEVTRTIEYEYSDGTKVVDKNGNPIVKEETLKFTRTGTVDTKTGEVTYKEEDWKPETTDKFDKVTSPTEENPEDATNLKDWTPDRDVDEKTVKATDDDIHEKVIYNPKGMNAAPDETWGLKGEKQTGTPTFTPETEKLPDGTPNTVDDIKLIDPTTGDPTDKVTINGQGTYTLNEDGTITFTPEPDFVGNPTPVGVTGTDKLGNTAKTTYTPHVVDPEDKGEATRTIHYTYLTEDGEEVTGDTVQTTELTRKAKSVDPKTGEVTEWGPWEKATLDAVENPDKEAGEGWSTTDKVDKLEVTEPGDKGIEYVVYQPEKPKGTPDETWGLKDQPQTGEPAFDVTTKKMPDGSDNEIVKVELLDADGNPTDTVTVPEGTYKLNEDGTIEFTPNKDFVGDPTPVKVRGTDKLGGTAETTYTPHVVDATETEEVKRTIEYEYNDGTPVVDKDGNPIVKEETLKFTRTPKSVDPETGEVTEWNDWAPDTTDTFEKVVSPTEDNPGDATNLKDWTPDGDVDKKTVKATDDDIYEKVIYNPKGVKATPDETYGLKGEPQTGKPDFKQETELLPDGTKNEIVERKLIDPQTGDPVDEVKIPGQGTYKMNPDGAVTFTPEPDFVGNPSPVGVVGTDKLGNTAKTTYTPHVVDPTDEGTATRTIHYTYLAPDGEEVTEDTEQTATLVRHAKKIDPKTGEVTEWGGWEKATLPAVDNPDDKATKDGKSWTTTDKVEDLEVTEPGDKGVVNVVYQAAPVPPEKVTDTTTVTRKIEYKYYDENGNEASKTITQTVELKRTAKKVDPETGEATEWNDWEIVDDKDNKTVTSPEIEGWTPDKTSVPPMDIDLTKEDPQDGINDELVVYTPEPPVGTPKKTYGKIGKPQSTDAKKLFEVTTPTIDEKDEKGNPIPNEIVKIELIDPETGEPAKTSVDPETGKTVYGPIPAYGINPETGEREQVGTYELDPETGIVTFKPNETFTGTPEPATLKATDKNGLDTTTTYTPNIPDKRQKVTVDREITYMYKKADGTEAPVLDEKGEPVKVVQTVTFVRETNVDPETGALTWTDWEPEEAVMGKVVSPTEDKTEAASGQKATDLEGWTPDKDVDEFKVTIDPETEQPFEPADDVVYYICGPVGSDKETWGAPGEQQKGTPKFTEGTGKITKYELTDPDPDDPNKKTVPGEGTYVLNPETGEITFTPEDGFTGKGTGVTVKATDENGKTAEGKYNPNVPEPETQTGKRTITYLYDDGTPVLDENGNPIVEEQIEEFTRTPKKVDPETGEVTEWNEWDKKDYPEKDSPEVDGYTPNKDKVDEDSAKPGDNKEEIVIYKKTSTDPTRETETETVKRVIHYRYLTRDGKIADEDVEQTVTFTREKVTSPEGEVTYTEWQVAAGDKNFAEVTSPVKTGYDVDREKVDAVTVAPETEDMEEWVIYTPTKDPSGEVQPPVGSDKETWGGKGDPQSDTPVFTKGTGNIPRKGAYSLENPDPDDPLKKTIPGEGVYELDPDTGKVTFTPEPEFVGDGTGVTVKVTDEYGMTATGEYVPHVVDNVQTSVSKKTITYHYDDGTDVLDENGNPLVKVEEKTFTRKGKVDPNNGNITEWGDWNEEKFDDVTSPEIPGYTPDKEKVLGEYTNPGDDITERVIYLRNPVHQEVEEKTITRIIRYRYIDRNGREAFADVTQSLKFERVMTKDDDGNVIETGSWIPADGEMNAVDSPVLDNYNVDRAVVDAVTIDPDAYADGAKIEEWVIYTPKTIWVTYVDEDGTTVYLEKTTEPKAAKGQKQQEPDAPADPVRLGAEFLGWDRSVDPEGNITYTARWKPLLPPDDKETIWVTYVDPDGVTIYLEKTTMPKGDPQTEPDAPADPVKDGFKFDGWDRSVDPEGNITYTAKWVPDGTDPVEKTKWVTYIDEDGKTIYMPKTDFTDEEPEGPAIPKKDGYTFIRWDREVDEDGNITYIARWEPTPATYWVTYVDPDGKTIYLEKTTVNKGEDEPAAPENPKKDGFTFEGWDRTVDEDGNITYTAIWKPIETDPTKPTDPTDPTKPTDPTDPTKPVDPTDPTKPADQGTQPSRKGSAAASGTVVKATGAKSPGTGDRNNILIWIIAAAAAAGAGVTAVVVRRRKKD